MEKHARINRKNDTGSIMEHPIGSTGRERPAAPGRDERQEPLDVNGCIRRFTRLFSPALKEKIRLRTALGDNELPVMGDPAQIAMIFAVLVTCGSRLTPGGSMTILTTLLPIDVGPVSRGTGSGCALLSFRAARARGEQIPNLSGLLRDGMLRAFFNVRHIVEKHHGCFRLCVREAEIDFNVYLPVAQAHIPPVRKVRTKTRFRSEKERL